MNTTRIYVHEVAKSLGKPQPHTKMSYANQYQKLRAKIQNSERMKKEKTTEK